MQPTPSARSSAGTAPLDAEPFERVCTVADVRPGALRGVTLGDGTPVCLANRGGTIVAVRDRCPHQKIALSDGNLTPEGTIVCAWHGAAYDCATGRAVLGPLGDGGTREGPLGRLVHFAVRVDDGVVFVGPPLPQVR